MAIDPLHLKGRARQTWLRSAARRIKLHPRGNLAQVVSLGRVLLQVRAVTGRGQWGKWLHRYWPHGYRIAADAMRAAKTLGGVEMCVLRKFGSSAAHGLTRKCLSKPARQRMLDLPAQAKKIGLDSLRLQALAASDDFDGPDEKPGSLLAVIAAEKTVYDHLQLLLKKTTMIVIDQVRDSESVEEEPDAVAIIAYPAEGKPSRHCRRTLDRAIAAAAGAGVQKKCQKCETFKGPDEFANSTRYCRICERARVKKYGKKKAASC